MQHRLAMSQKPTTCGLARFVNEMNWCRVGRYLFALNSPGSTTSARSGNLTACRTEVDLRHWRIAIVGSEHPWQRRMSACGTKRTSPSTQPVSAFGGKADIAI